MKRPPDPAHLAARQDRGGRCDGDPSGALSGRGAQTGCDSGTGDDGPARWLSDEEAEAAFLDLDPLAVVRETLAGPPAGGSPPAVLRVCADRDEVRLHDGPSGREWALSASCALRLWTAGLGTAAMCALAPGGVVTAGVVGAGPPAAELLVQLALRLPGLTHVALHDRDPVRTARLWWRLARALRERGVGLTFAADVRETLLGADLVLLTGPAEQLRPDWTAPGAVVVNATGADLPEEMYAFADHLVVDDWRFVGPAGAGRRLFTRRSESRRALELAGGRRPVESRLGAVIADSTGRWRDADESVLVELLGTAAYDATFLTRLCRAAVRRSGAAAPPPRTAAPGARSARAEERQ
ncbi:hypothetical protein [Kitasatospora sp. NPDC088346]|uniref:hypothetical protein n=1 Tax=Kitasatospora sp. NPDC088346 TaxID=3364073 RepID=UPI0038116BF2